jgi:hypothetical protein
MGRVHRVYRDRTCIALAGCYRTLPGTSSTRAALPRLPAFMGTSCPAVARVCLRVALADRGDGWPMPTPVVRRFYDRSIIQFFVYFVNRKLYTVYGTIDGGTYAD